METFEKDMIYYPIRLEKPEVIAQGEYNNFKYYVLNLGTHPCAYIDVTDTKLVGMEFGDIYYKTKIECHCGFTYSRNYLTSVDESGKRYYIGWDYAHYGDYIGYETMFPSELIMGSKMYNTAEMVQECKNVINQIVEYLQEEENGLQTAERL